MSDTGSCSVLPVEMLLLCPATRGAVCLMQGGSGVSLSPQDSSQIELLKELLDLQKDMIVMMLSLLEGELIGLDRVSSS